MALVIVLSMHAQGLAQQQDQGPKSNPEVSNEAKKQFVFGIFYLKKGNFRRAEQQFQAAIQLDGNFSDAWLGLGEAREKLPHRSGAAEAYLKYLELAPEAKNASAIRERSTGSRNALDYWTLPQNQGDLAFELPSKLLPVFGVAVVRQRPAFFHDVQE